MSMSHRFEILDEVLNDFMNSNECRYTMPQMLALPENTIEYIKFFRRDIPYLATVSMYNILGFASKRKLVIQLPSCDFLFKEREGTPVPRQKSPTWISMPEALDHFTGLLDITPDHDKGMCFYNFAAQGVDVIMVSSHSSAPDVMVSYEPDYPYRDDDISTYDDVVRPLPNCSS